VSDDARRLGGNPAFEQPAFFVQNNFPRDTTPRVKSQIHRVALGEALEKREQENGTSGFASVEQPASRSPCRTV
jgi:hypothetical protein